MRYDYKHFADDLPVVPAGSFNHENHLIHEMYVTATGRFSSIQDQSQAGPSQVRTVMNVEISEAEIVTNTVVSDHLPLQVTPLGDGEPNEISPKDAAATESEFNALSISEQPSSPLSEMATPSFDPESETTNALEDPLRDQLLE